MDKGERTQVWRRIIVKRIVDKQYRMGDIVRYNILFEGCYNPILVDRDDLKKYRPRGYLRHLEDFEKKDTYRLEKVLQRETTGADIYYRFKFFKYPQSDNSWVKASLVDGFHYLEQLHASGKLIGQELIHKPIVRAIPCQELIDRLDINKAQIDFLDDTRHFSHFFSFSG